MKFIGLTELCFCFLLLGVTACRTRPKMDLNYQPKRYTEKNTKKTNTKDFKHTSHVDKNWNAVKKDTIDLTSVQTGNKDWELFAAKPMTSRSTPVEEINDRHWGPIYFAFNQIFIGETEREKLEKLADYLNRNPQYVTIIEGHCDKRGSDEYNRTLGEKRAIAVRDYLASLGVDDSKLQTISYGEEKLVDSGETENAHSRNRRAEFIVGLPK